jgi:hypothetical protein
VLSDWLLDRLTTRAYDYRQFGPPTPLACGSNNLLKNASASASSTFYGYSPLRTVDGSRDTTVGPDYGWANADTTSTTPALPATLQLAFAAPTLAEQVLVYSSAEWEVRDYDLQYFDGTRWDTIERVRGNIQTVREHRFPATQMMALRILGLSGPDKQTGYVRVNEVEAYRCTALVVAMPMPATSSRFFSLSPRFAPNVRIPLRQ